MSMRKQEYDNCLDMMTTIYLATVTFPDISVDRIFKKREWLKGRKLCLPPSNSTS